MLKKKGLTGAPWLTWPIITDTHITHTIPTSHFVIQKHTKLSQACVVIPLHLSYCNAMIQSLQNTYIFKYGSISQLSTVIYLTTAYSHFMVELVTWQYIKKYS